MRRFAALGRPWGIAALVCAGVLLVSVLCAGRTFRGPTGATLLDDYGVARPSALPYSGPSPDVRPMDFTFHLQRDAFTPGSFVFVPDDHLVSIKVGGRLVSLDGIDPKKLDDYDAGFSYRLGRELAPGDNTVAVRVLNHGGAGGLDVHADPAHGLAALELGFATLAALGMLIAAMRGAGYRWTSAGLAVVAVVVRLAYLWVTRFTVRGHDPTTHLDYVHYLLDHHAIPKAAEGYAFYHPPLYYFLSALTHAASGALGFGEHEIIVILQLQSVAFELGFAVFGVATARLFLERVPEAELGRRLWSRDGLATLCAALLLLWPSSVMHSVRMGNDDLVYLCFGGALYFGSRWWLGGRENGARDFLAAAAFGAAGVVTKTNSVVVFAVLGVLLVARVLRAGDRRLARLVRLGAPLALLFVVSSGLALHESLGATLAGKQDSLLIANAHFNSAELMVGNRAQNYLWFDLKTFVTAAFTSAWDDAKGRQYFWNYLLKTSLFGEWELPHAWEWNLAVLVSVACLAMCGVLVAGTLMRKRSELVGELPLWALALLLVASLVLLRMKIPYSCTGDFRYVLPVMVPLAYAYVRALVALRGQGWARLAWSGMAVGWLFPALSAAFIASIVWS